MIRCRQCKHFKWLRFENDGYFPTRSTGCHYCEKASDYDLDEIERNDCKLFEQKEPKKK